MIAIRDLHQQWAQHCEEESRIAAWRLHNNVRISVGRTEKARIRSSKQRLTGAISWTGISNEERELEVDSGALSHMKEAS